MSTNVKTRKLLALVISIMLLVSLFPITTYAAGTTYYVDSVAGNDSNNGTNTSTPWQTLTKVNNTTFQPGDQILFKRGSAWTGALVVSSSGNSTSQITYGAYGTGNKPIINGNGVNQTISIVEKSNVTVQDLDITNNAATGGDRNGIYIYPGSSAVTNIQILNNDIHNVKGKYGENDYFWSAAIDCDGYVANIDNLLIEGNNIHDNECQGIYTKGSGGIRYLNLKIRNNTFNKNVKGDIIVGVAQNPLIEYNVATNAGQGYTGFYYIVSMWEFACDGSTFQYNEVANVNAPDLTWGGDSQAFDVDIGSLGNHVFQYNYTHNNEGGTLLVMDNNPDLVSTIYRYNISQNDGHYNCNPWDNDSQYWDGARGSTVSINKAGSGGAYVYNNVWFNNTADGIRIKDTTANYKNNIFYTTSEYKYPTTNPTYDYNCFYGGVAPSTDSHKLTSNPNFVSPGSGGNGRNTVDGYKLQANSPCINSGVSISNNGGKDYWGTTLYNNAPDIGAQEFTGTPVSPTPTPTPGSNVHSGNYSTKATITTSDAYRYIIQYPTVSTSTNMTGSVWVKGSGKIEYLVQDTSNWSTLSGVTITATDTWTQYNLPTFNTGSRTNVAVLCKVPADTSGTLYIDDLIMGVSGGTNLITNPGFEAGTSPWQGFDGILFSQQMSAEPNVHSGTYSTKGTITTADAYKYIISYPTVTASTNMTGSVWVKGSGKIEYLVQDTSNWSTIAGVTIIPTDTWTQYNLPTFNTGSRTSVAILCKVPASTSGTLYIDDLFLGISGGTNVITNPGFETGVSPWQGLDVAPFFRVTN